MTIVKLWVCNFQGAFFFAGFRDGDDNCFFPGNRKVIDFKTVVYDIIGR